MEQIKNCIKDVLPSLREETVLRLAEHLVEECGVEDVADLCYVKEIDLKDHLKPIQCRKLLERWAPSYKENATVIETAGPISERNSQPEICTSSTSVSNKSGSDTLSPVNTCSGQIPMNVNNWQLTFTIPWHKMPKDVKLSLETGRRPSPSDRREMVRILVDEIRLKCLNPTRRQLQHIVSKIVGMYPAQFQDRDDEGMVIGSGFISLLNQVKSRIENKNRHKTSISNLKRSHSQTNDSSDVPSARLYKKADSYGCISWQPGLPDDTTDIELKEQQNELKEVFSTGPEHWNNATVDKLMACTYYLQRIDLNSQPPPSISVLTEKWPFLFTERWLLSHFKTLVGIDLQEKFVANRKTAKILNFMERTMKSDVNSILQSSSQCESRTQEMAAVVLSLLLYFRDEREIIITLVDETSTIADITASNLPSSPCLIVLGDSILTSRKFMLSIDQTVVCENISSISAGLAMLFGSFYIFNIQYPEAVGTTLEFIQRCFVQINPESGSKIGKSSKKKKQTVSPKVVTLIKALADYEWMDQ